MKKKKENTLDSQTVRAKENPKLSLGGPSQRQTPDTDQRKKILGTYSIAIKYLQHFPAYTDTVLIFKTTFCNIELATSAK